MNIQIDGGGTRILFQGRLTEDADLEPLLPRLTGTVVLDLAGITRINSYGAREWLHFIRSVPRDVHVILEKCPVVFVNQLNMIADFAGRATVRSVYVPYLCTKCNEPCDRLVEVPPTARTPLPAPGSCDACGGELEADLLEDQFFAFLRLRPT